MTTNSDDLAICVTCGTQFDELYTNPPKSCKICDDPRQFVPATGQAWTCLTKLKSQNFTNSWTRDKVNPNVWFIQSVPETLPDHLAGVNLGLTSGMGALKIGIGQRAIFLQTEQGNVLWDLVPFIDDRFAKEVQDKGGLKAIVISHPHFYNTHLDWAAAFDCPVYLAYDEREWLCRTDTDERRKFIDGPIGTAREIVAGVTAIKCGGHFPGSLVLHWAGAKILCLADTIMTVPSGLSFHEARQPGTNTYSFMWSYPNMIPLDPEALMGIWEAVKPFEFTTTFGGFPSQDVRREDAKKLVLESAQNWVKKAGWSDAKILQAKLN